MTSRLLCCSGSLEGGGSERQLWQLATQINREDFDPALYLLYRKGKYLSSLPSEMPVYDFWTQPPAFGRLPGSIRGAQIRHLAKVILETGTKVLYDRTFHMTLVTAPACRQTACPRVSTIVSPPSKDFVGSDEGFKFLKKRILRAAYKAPGCKTLAVSESVAEDAANFYGIPREYIDVVPSPIDIDSICTAAVQSVGTEGNAEPSICVVGRMTAEKRQRIAILALHKLVNNQNRRVRLELVGDGPNRRELEELGKSLGIEMLLSFHGRLENPFPIIKSSQALLLTSAYEGLPNVVMEAMALKTPVIATRCSTSIDELLGQNERGVVIDPTDDEKAVVEGLSSAVSSVFDEQDAWSKRTQQAEAYVRAYHGLPEWLSKMSTILKEASQGKLTGSHSVESG